MKYRLIHFLLPISIIMTACVPAGPVSTATRQPTATAALTRTPSPTSSPTITPTPSPTPPPAWAADLVETIHNTKNTTWMRGGIYWNLREVATNPAVAEYEATHVEVKSGRNFPATEVITLEEAKARGLVEGESYWPLVSDVEAVTISDKEAYVWRQDENGVWGIWYINPDGSDGPLVEGKAGSGEWVMMAGQNEAVMQSGQDEAGNWGWYIEVDGQEIFVRQDQVKISYTKVDDGLDAEGNLQNERLVTRIEIFGEVPAVLQESGFEGEWVERVFQEGEWHQVPQPEKMIEALEMLRQGMSPEKVMSQMQAELPSDWRDLPVVDPEAIDVYLAQQAKVWEELQKMITPEELVSNGSFPNISSRLAPVYNAEFDISTTPDVEGAAAPWGTVRVGEEGMVVVSWPLRMITQSGGFEHPPLILLNALVDLKGNGAMESSLSKGSGDQVNEEVVWQELRSGEKFLIKLFLILGIVPGKTKEEWGDYSNSVEVAARNEALVPRGVLLADGTVFDKGFFWRTGSLYQWIIVLSKYGFRLLVRLPNGETAEYEVIPTYQLDALEQLLVPAVPMVPAPGK